jgi:hypothetical protein
MKYRKKNMTFSLVWDKSSELCPFWPFFGELLSLLRIALASIHPS